MSVRFSPRSVTYGRWLRAGFNGGYTIGMKTAVSIPDDVFEKVERLARRGQRSRTEGFCARRAVHVARPAPEQGIGLMHRGAGEGSGQDVQPEPCVRTQGRRVHSNTKWY